MNKLKLLTIFGLAGLYLTVAGTSYFVLGALGHGTGPGLAQVIKSSPSSGSKIDLTAPKTETCPINGAKYTLAERQLWDARRPIAVMAENHTDARPQSGFSRSDVVYEAVAEGGITRFMGIFYCAAQAQDTSVAPVRSSRIYFVKLAQEYGDKPLYVHVGGANAGAGETAIPVRALEYLGTIGWRVAGGNDFDSTFDSGYPTFWRDYERLNRQVATEHTMSTSTEKIWAQAVKRNLGAADEGGTPWNKTFVPWQFTDDAQDTARGSVAKVNFEFWKGYPDYDVQWDYNASANSYSRINGGQASVDHNNNEPITAKNVVIEFATEQGPLDEHLHMLYTVEGTGKAIVFQNGNAIQATWTKASPTGRTTYKDVKTGKDIPFVRGRIWIEIVPKGNQVQY